MSIRLPVREARVIVPARFYSATSINWDNPIALPDPSLPLLDARSGRIAPTVGMQPGDTIGVRLARPLDDPSLPLNVRVSGAGVSVVDTHGHPISSLPNGNNLLVRIHAAATAHGTSHIDVLRDQLVLTRLTVRVHRPITIAVRCHKLIVRGTHPRGFDGDLQAASGWTGHPIEGMTNALNALFYQAGIRVFVRWDETEYNFNSVAGFVDHRNPAQMGQIFARAFHPAPWINIYFARRFQLGDGFQAVTYPLLHPPPGGTRIGQSCIVVQSQFHRSADRIAGVSEGEVSSFDHQRQLFVAIAHEICHFFGLWHPYEPENHSGGIDGCRHMLMYPQDSRVGTLLPQYKINTRATVGGNPLHEHSVDDLRSAIAPPWSNGELVARLNL